MAQIPQVPPIHDLHHSKQSRPKSHSLTAAYSKGQARKSRTKSNSAQVSSPEVISSLISSLSAISSPAEDFYDNIIPNARNKGVPLPPVRTWSKTIREDMIPEDASQDTAVASDEAASPPVVRTGKSRSGVVSTHAQKRLSSSPSMLSSSGSFAPEQITSIGKISIEPRPDPSYAGSNSSIHSRSNSMRSLNFKESKERMRDLKRQSKSKLRESENFSPTLSHRGSLELLEEDTKSLSGKVPIRAKSMCVTSSSPTESGVSASANGLAVPTRESSKRHSFTGHRRRNSKSKSIKEEPVAEDGLDHEEYSNERSASPIEKEAKEISEKLQAFQDERDFSRMAMREESLSRKSKRISLPVVSKSFSSKDQFGSRSMTLGTSAKENRDFIREPRSRNSISKSFTESVPENGRRKSTRPPPSIADSIDDDIDEYLANPKLTQRVRDPVTGRIIAFSEVGDPKGSTVFCCVGMGTTRYLTAFYDELATTLKLRLITPDRPGIGESEPYPDGMGTPLGWPDDIRTICAHLEIQRFSVLAHSAGAVYALATALRMPQHIRGRIYLLAPWIPPSQMVAVGIQKDQSPITSLPYSQRLLRALPTSLFKIANSSLFAMTSSSIASAMPTKSKRRKRRSANDAESTKDKMSFRSRRNSLQFVTSLAQDAKPDIVSVASSPALQSSLFSKNKDRESEYELRLIHAIWDAATANANPAVDLLVCLERRQEIGFRYADINKEVVIQHGSKDSRVPVENVEWLGRRMRRCEVRVLEGENHGLMASAKVMSDVLTEMAQEWDSWNAIVGRRS